MLRPATLAALAFAAAALAAPCRAQDRPTGSRDDWPRSSGRDGYVLSLHGGWLSSDVNLDEISQSRLDRRGDYLWFRRSGRSYLIEDASALARASALFEPLHALEPEQEALRERERALDDRERSLDMEEEEIEAAQERLEPGDSADYDEDSDEGSSASQSPAPAPSVADEREREDLERRMDEVRARQRALQTEQRAFEREERALDQKEEKIERDCEAQLWRLVDEAIASGVAKPAGSR